MRQPTTTFKIEDSGDLLNLAALIADMLDYIPYAQPDGSYLIGGTRVETDGTVHWAKGAKKGLRELIIWEAKSEGFEEVTQ